MPSESISDGIVFSGLNRIFNQFVLRKDINLFRNQIQFFAFGDWVTRGIAACQRDMHVLFVVFYQNMRQCPDGVDFFDFGTDHRGFVFGGDLPFVRADVAGGGLFLPFVVRVQFPREAVVVPDAFFDASFKCVGFAEEFGNEGVFGFAVNGFGAAGLFDFTVVHDDDFVGNFKGFFLVVRY